MAIVNIGSINIDNIYRVEDFSAPGETQLVTEYARGLGGKGANQSIALARAGSEVRHVGAVGEDGAWAIETLRSFGVDTRDINVVEEATGHAIIQVNRDGENSILVYPGANGTLTSDRLSEAVSGMKAGDWLLFQNETNLTRDIAAFDRPSGVQVCYCAAPFIADLVLPVLPHIDLLVVNEVEARSLASHFGDDEARIPVPALLVTRGKNGASYVDHENVGGQRVFSQSAFSVEPVDTTGAGDTFLGYFLSSLEQGRDISTALQRASAASAIQISHPGAADAIPHADSVDAFLKEHTF